MRGAPHLPAFAAWRHHDAREGFEVVFFDQHTGGLRVEGQTTAVEHGDAFAARYAIELDQAWHTRSAQVFGQTADGQFAAVLDGDGRGTWSIEGRPAPHLEGCLDVDLECSALTNAFPVKRLGLRRGEEAPAPAVYVRAHSPDVERLEQRYLRIDDGSGHERYEYSAPAFDFRALITYDDAGLVLEYPGLATRVGF